MWTIKQVVRHCVDTERIFGYRVCRFAAADATSLPGFDQNAFVSNTDYTNVALPDLTDELVYLRRGNLGLCRGENAGGKHKMKMAELAEFQSLEQRFRAPGG